MQSSLKYWVAISTLNEIGPHTIRKLLSYFKSPENIFKAKVHDLMEIRGISDMKAEKIASFSDWDRINRLMDNLNSNGVKVLLQEDNDYPELLKQTGDGPHILFVKGEIIEEDKYAIAVIGSRKATHYGISVTEKISTELSSIGFTIVSGMARGVDSIAHRAALKKGRRTIAVMGSGHDVVYPPENRGLMERICENGAVITQFPPGTKPNRENFPIRNRLISGLSLGVVVTEAATKSGALITAGYALEHNREVFAIPGSILSEYSSGTHNLIQKGAKLVSGAEDIVSELAPQLKGFIRDKKKSMVELSEEEKKICSFLSSEPVHIDNIIREAGIPSEKILIILLNLELKNIVKQLEGKKFQLI